MTRMVIYSSGGNERSIWEVVRKIESSEHTSPSHNQVSGVHQNQELIEALFWALAVSGIVVAIVLYWFCCRRRRISSGGIIRVPQTGMQPVGAQSEVPLMSTGVRTYYPGTMPNPGAGQFCSIATPYTISMPSNVPSSNVPSEFIFPASPPAYDTAMAQNVKPYSHTPY